MKKKIIAEIQEVTALCKICSFIGHYSSSCWNKDRYICENTQCGQFHIKDMCQFQPFIVSCLRQAVSPPVVPCIRRVIPVVSCLQRVSLNQTRDPSEENSKRRYVSKTSSKNIPKKFKNNANHTETMVPDSKINDEISKLKTNTEDHHRVSETDLCVTFSEAAVSKQSVSSAVTGTMFEEFNSSNSGGFYTTGRK